jgi:hypothetical protein
VNVNLIKWSTIEPLFFDESVGESSNTIRVDYEYDNYTIGSTGVYHMNFNDRIEFGGAYFTEHYQKIGGETTDAPTAVDTRKLLGKVIYYWDRINYHFYYLDGGHIQWNNETVYSLDGDPTFFISFIDFRNYLRINQRGNFAARLRLGLSSNQDSPFAPFVLDSYVNIRGVGNRVDRGTGAIILNVEHRQTIYDQKDLAAQFVVFSDMGSWRNPGGNFNDFSDPENFVLFAGGGIRLIHKKIYNAILRIDYGADLQDVSRSGFVLGIGQYF